MMRWPRQVWICCALCCILAAPEGRGVEGERPVWTARETELANEYLARLVSHPGDGRVLDLLWELYEKRGETGLLLGHIATQAGEGAHPNARLVHALLLKRAGEHEAAAAVAGAVLEAEPGSAVALRLLADTARELGDAAAAAGHLESLAAVEAARDPGAGARLWLEAGDARLSLGEVEAAAAAWEKAAGGQSGSALVARQAAQRLLQAGQTARAAVLFEALAENSAGAARLDALIELSRLRALAEDFEGADGGLWEGMSLLHPRGGEFERFLRERARLHERFNRLDELREELEKAVESASPTEAEAALLALVLFHQLTAQPDAMLEALRRLTDLMPEDREHAARRLRAELEHGDGEAAREMLRVLTGGGELPPGLVFAACEAELRTGEEEAAEKRLMDLLAGSGTDETLANQVAEFAQRHHLDAVVEAVLRSRMAREPGRASRVLDLAAHLFDRREAEAAEGLLAEYLAGGQDDAERAERVSAVAGFYLARNRPREALDLLREQSDAGQGGVEGWLLLADLLSGQGEREEARRWLEKAWEEAADDEARMEIDERLLSLLASGQTREEVAEPGADISLRMEGGGELRLPASVTGAGFASDDTPPDPAPGGRGAANPAVAEFAERTAAAAEVGEAAQVLRAAWWALRAGDIEGAYGFMRGLLFDEAGAERELPLEAEHLLFEIARTDGNHALAERVLRRLMEREPGQRARHTLRLVELMLENEEADRQAALRQGLDFPLGEGAVVLLREALEEDPGNELLLSALSRLLMLRREADEAKALWRRAAEKSAGGVASLYLERLAELELQTREVAAHVEAVMTMLAREADIGRRREMFRRFLDRLCAPDSGSADLEPHVLRERLELVADGLRRLAAREPLDAFWPEAEAAILLRGGELEGAFAAMRRAYYMAPETPFSLEQLRDMALRLDDAREAVYFQRRVAAAAPAAEVAGEYRRLIELMEQAFMVEEADQIRLRLERRFARDAAALAELADYYRETGQDQAERRVRGQMARVQPWDAAVRLELALLCLRLADEDAAEEHLRRVLEGADGEAAAAAGEAALLPLPLTLERAGGRRGAAGDVADWVDSASHLPDEWTKQVTRWLRKPLAALARVPGDSGAIRLRALEEMGGLMARRGGAARESWERRWGAADAPALEALWALARLRGAAGLPGVLERLLAGDEGPEAVFARLWLLLQGGHARAAVEWVRRSIDGEDEGEAGRRVREDRAVLQTCLLALANSPVFPLDEEDVRAVAASGALSHVALDGLAGKLASRQIYGPALALGGWLRENRAGLGADYAIKLAGLAESAERRDLAADYVRQALHSQPPRPGRFQGVHDPLLHGLASMAVGAPWAPERQEFFAESWRRLQTAPASDLTTLRSVAAAGLAGAVPAALRRLRDWLGGDFLVARPMGQRPGGLRPQGSLRFDDSPQTGSFWEDTREVGALLAQQGLSRVRDEMESRASREWGVFSAGSKPGLDFDARAAALIRDLRREPHPRRLHMIREWLAPVDRKAESSVELLADFGAKLEAAGLPRCAMAVYGELPERAPTNSEYVVWLLRVGEAAMEVEPGRSFSLQLIQAKPPFKPPTPGDETLREIHARFMAMDHDLEALRKRAFPPSRLPTLPGRLPPETAYLRELALLAEKRGLVDEALRAWADYEDCFNRHEDDGLDAGSEPFTRRAALLAARGDDAGALALLARVPQGKPVAPEDTEALLLEASLRCKAAGGQGDPALLRLMRRVVRDFDARAVCAVASRLREAGLATEAARLLNLAARVEKNDENRLRLLLEGWEDTRAGLLQASVEGGVGGDSGLEQAVAALFRARAREGEMVERLMEEMAQTARVCPLERAAEMVELLLAQARGAADRVLAAAALAPWAEALDEKQFAVMMTAWRESARGEEDRRCVERAAGALLDAGRADWALEAGRFAGDLPSPRRVGRLLPVMARAAHALGDEVLLSEIFAEVVRLPSPGGSQVEAWAEAFVACGRVDWAGELYEAAVRQAGASDTLGAPLVRAWLDFLIRQKRFTEAETLLMATDSLIPPRDQPGLWVSLYRAWGRLGQLPGMAARLHLPDGVRREIEWLAAEDAGE